MQALDTNASGTVKSQRLIVGPRLTVGAKLQRKLPGMSATAKALFGHKLQSGAETLTRATPRQAAAVARVPMALIRAVAKATPGERAAMRCGLLTVEEVHRQQLADKRFSDTRIEKFITAADLNRVFAAYKRLTTRPATNGAADGCNPVTMPREVYAAAEVLIGEFLQADYEERIKFFRREGGEEEDAVADELEAAAELYERWRTASKDTDDGCRHVVPRPATNGTAAPANNGHGAAPPSNDNYGTTASADWWSELHANA